MTIQEMHIEVGLASQQVASAVNRRFLPEEIDWVLNKIIGRFVNQAVKPKEFAGENDFQEHQLDTDKIRTLVAHDVSLPVTVSGNTYSAILPSGYSHLIEDNSMTLQACEKPLVSTELGKTYIAILKLKPSAKGTAPYYQNLAFKISNTTIIDSSDMPSGLNDKDMLFTVTEVLRELLPSRLPQGVTAYYENYGLLEVSNALIIVSPTAISASIAYDGVITSAILQELDVIRPLPSDKSRKVVNRLTKSDRVGQLRQSSFAKSTAQSPISVLERNILKVYGDESFIVTQVLISYVRKARKVALSLSRNCDLPEETHQEICDLAVEYLKLTIQDPSYPSTLQDNKLRN